VSLVAQYLMTRKYLENWTLWIIIDVVYVGMFIYKGLYLTAGNYAIYLVLAVMGHIAWKKSLGGGSGAVTVPASEAATA
jgi:nicotinamide mononucleotide transporter